jgi:gliding motility-associated-like protein
MKQRYYIVLLFLVALAFKAHAQYPLNGVSQPVDYNRISSFPPKSEQTAKENPNSWGDLVGGTLQQVKKSWVPSDSDFCYMNYAENKGQWNSKVLYQADFRGGRLFLEKNGLMYVFYPSDLFEYIHPEKGGKPADIGNRTFTFQAIHMEFQNSQGAVIQPTEKRRFYYNYFIGNNPQQWASRVGVYQNVYYNELYPGISAKVFSRSNDVRYDFTVTPNGNPADIQLHFTGQNGLSLKNGKLVIHTEIGEIEEAAPFAYQLVNGEKVKVDCSFTLDKDNIGFKVADNYNKSIPLVIDPTLVFATYTGSTADNWGMSAAYDANGDGYTSGIVFGTGYPVTTGAFQTTFGGAGTGGGNFYTGFDISISKFTPNGYWLMYSTYLGGSDNEEPSSIIVDNNQDLVVLGKTYSTNFPTTTTAYSKTLSGGADFIISKFDSNGTKLLASTYIGGSADDGVNMSSLEYVLKDLKYNYADDDRGDVIVDGNNNIYVASCTNSTNFPTTPGAYKTTACGMQDGCAFEMDPNLTTLKWSTYLGGSNNDAAYNLALNSKGEIYITGGTESANFPTTPGVINPSYGGNIDGFLLHLSPNGSTLLQSTYIGTGAYDQSFFVQTDKYDNVYIYGQTGGSYPVTAGVYSVPNGGQFIHELNPTLSSTVFSTVFGTGKGTPDIAPSAFLVDKCQNIYISGWGGVLYGYNVPTSTTNGLAVTGNAFQSTTDGSDFYFMVLQRNASALLYATYFGGPISLEHVDGGTSRFDKTGIIYQAICEGCGGNSDMPTSPGAWSATNNSPNCNNALVKFKMDLLETVASFIINPLVTAGCAPFSVTFKNTTSFGSTYRWFFGDGDSSHLAVPSHIYNNPGTYKIMLIATDSATCNITDTAYATVRVVPPLKMNPIPNTLICFGDSVNLDAVAPGAISFLWSPAAGLSNDSIHNPNASPAITSKYIVVAQDSFCTASDTVQVQVDNGKTTILPNPAELCQGDSVKLTTDSSFVSYSWSGGSTNSFLEVKSAGEYYVSTVDKHGCKGTDSTFVKVFTKVPLSMRDTAICYGQIAQLRADSGSYGYAWSPPATLSEPNSFDPIAHPLTTTTYTVTVTNGPCVSIDSCKVTVKPTPHISVSPDSTMIIYGQSVSLSATGDSGYTWFPSTWLSCTECASPVATPDSNIKYYVEVTNAQGCSALDSVIIDIEPTFYIPNAFTPNGDGLNDVFRPECVGYIALDAYIFNRWGELLYHWNTLDGGWDGTFKGTTVQEDTYVYMMTATTYTHKTYRKIGSVTLLR